MKKRTTILDQSLEQPSNYPNQEHYQEYIESDYYRQLTVGKVKKVSMMVVQAVGSLDPKKILIAMDYANLTDMLECLTEREKKLWRALRHCMTLLQNDLSNIADSHYKKTRHQLTHSELFKIWCAWCVSRRLYEVLTSTEVCQNVTELLQNCRDKDLPGAYLESGY
jgi:hypothetical protein